MKVTAKSFGDYYLNCGLQGITIHTNDKKNQSVSNKYSQEQFYEAVKMIGVLRLYNENTDMSMKEFEDKRQEIMREIQEELAGITEQVENLPIDDGKIKEVIN